MIVLCIGRDKERADLVLYALHKSSTDSFTFSIRG